MRDLWRSPLPDHFITDIELFGIAAGLRPVAKKEGPDADRIFTCSGELADAGFIVARNERTGCVYISREAHRIERLMELENGEFGGGDPTARISTIREIGLALGYPECCAAAFARHRMQDDAHVMGNFIECEKAVAGDNIIRGLPWQLNFLPPMVSPVFYYPCHARCRASMDLADRYLQAFADLRPDAGATMKKRLSGVVMTSGRWDFVMFYGRLEGRTVVFDSWLAPVGFHPVPPPSAAFSVFLDALPPSGRVIADNPAMLVLEYV